MKIENVYTSVACNKTPQSADWGNNGLIAFAASNAITLFDPEYNGSAKIIKTYARHTKRVNTVKWVKQKDNTTGTYLISGSDDGTAIIWDLKHLENPKWEYLEAHESGINVVEAIDLSGEGKITIATGSTDTTIKLWHKATTANFSCFQTIPLQSGFCFALAMTVLPSTNQILLAYAGDNDHITLFVESFAENKQKFIRVHDFVGHDDWVRCLDFTTCENDLLLASSSQDHFIRLWKISSRSAADVRNNKMDLLNIPEGDIHVEETILQIPAADTHETLYFAASLESVLHGHEDWVYGVHWKRNGGALELLSCSTDKTMIIWSCTDDGAWMESVRVGEVGGNLLGFYGCKFSGDGKQIFAHGFQGSFHIWKQSSDTKDLWVPQVVVGGHFHEVRDICWEPTGKFLLSVSADETTRIHAPWVRSNVSQVTWHELARPQVHGYSMQCIIALSTYKFASGAEEKIVRIFQAPANFIENFKRICKTECDAEGDKLLETLPKGASVPSLGLSNKAVYNLDETQTSKHVKDEYPENYFVPVEMEKPPQEEALIQNTLWPELQKLYGHGYEIFAICSSKDGKIVATACKAQSPEHAQIILWDTSTWKQIRSLLAHKLTVTQMKFSPNGNYLLSVSRDRTFALFEKKDDTTVGNFVLCAFTGKTNGIHARIIWSCDWSHDSEIFATCSRDGKAVAWHKGAEETSTSLKNWKDLSCLNLEKEPITAICFAPKYFNELNEYLVALGLESGLVMLYTVSSQWTHIYSIEKDCAHHMDVKKMQFRPNYDDLELATCSSDTFVRIFKIIG